MSEDDARAGHEAARLLAAAQDWLASAAPHLAPVDEEGRTCPCPLCRVVATVREADPDEVGRWVDAAVAGLGAALRDMAPADGTGAAAADDAQTPVDPRLVAAPDPDTHDPDTHDPGSDEPEADAVERADADPASRSARVRRISLQPLDADAGTDPEDQR